VFVFGPQACDSFLEQIIERGICSKTFHETPHCKSHPGLDQ